MSHHSLTMHKTGVCREMVLGFLTRNELGRFGFCVIFAG
jgi:hypothetical protein